MEINLVVLAFSTYLLLSVLLSNYVFKRGVSFYLSRKVMHFAAAPAFIALPLAFDSIEAPVGLALAWFIAITGSHLLLRYTGENLVPGFARAGRLSEVYFALASLISIAALWHIDPWLAVVPPLWLALGDGVTGLVRSYTSRREVKDWWGSLACVIVCAVIAIVLVTPIVAGLVGAVTATLAERYSGDAEGAIIRLDDNLAMPLAGLAGMLPFFLI